MATRLFWRARAAHTRRASASRPCWNQRSHGTDFDRRMSTYVGRLEAELVAGLGVPSRAHEVEGRRLLAYEFSGAASSPGVSGPVRRCQSTEICESLTSSPRLLRMPRSPFFPLTM